MNPYAKELWKPIPHVQKVHRNMQSTYDSSKGSIKGTKIFFIYLANGETAIIQEV